MYRVVAIHPPLGFSQRGQRENNEDYILPAAGRATTADRLFVVCDGVGGADKGELASLIAAESLVRYFRDNPGEAIDSPFVKAALVYVEEAFDQAITQELGGTLAGMSTTLTLLSLHNQGATIAHVGDSRVYHVRGNQILHQTHDHSLVNELVRAKQISPEEAINHPRRNVITRAIQGSSRPTAITVYITQDVAANDYFFLCTDGVLECVTDELLATVLANPKLSDNEKLDELLAGCVAGSKDNFSGYLVRVAAVAPVERPNNTSDLEQPDVDAPFQLLLDDDDDPDARRGDRAENRNWLQRLFS